MFKFIKLFVVLVMGMLLLVGSGGSGGGSDDNSTAVHSATEDSPVITLKGNPTVTIIQGTKYTDAGATATDKEDGTVKVTVSGSVDSSKLGTYIITYTAIDKAGNKTTKKRVVKVVPAFVTKTKKMIVVSGIYNKKNDWSKDFDSIKVANVHHWAEMKKSIPFNKKIVIDLGLESGTEKDKAKHKNPSSILLRWWVNNKAYLKLDFRDKNGYLLHTFKFNKSEGHNSAYIEFDGNRHNASDAELKSTIQGFIRVENGQFRFEGEYNTKVSNYIVGLASKTWHISKFNEIVKVDISMGVIHTYAPEGEARMPLYIYYQEQNLSPEIDKVPPVITLKGNAKVTIVQGTKYTDAGATATDKEDGTVKVTVSGSVDSSKLGTYIITYTAKDKAGNEATKKRTVKVVASGTPIVDKTAPLITLKGKSTVSIVQGTKYTDAGATAKDNIDGIVKVIKSGSVDTSKIGTYTLTYTATDKAGNKATATRKVKVTLPPDTVAPLITITGNNPLEITQGETFSDPGATATDDRDGVVTVTPSGTVDMSTVGSYTITYTAKDKAGNEANVTRTVIVKHATIITVLPIKKTGQTISYYPKDDGDYQKGVTPSYTRDDENEIVIDNITKLQWQDTEEAKTVKRTWQGAKDYCTNLNLGGYSDWQLPTRKELSDIIDYGCSHPSINSKFENTYSDVYWSSTSVVGDSGYAWIVSFSYGYQGHYYNKTDNYYLRCIRAGQ